MHFSQLKSEDYSRLLNYINSFSEEEIEVTEREKDLVEKAKTDSRKHAVLTEAQDSPKVKEQTNLSLLSKEEALQILAANKSIFETKFEQDMLIVPGEKDSPIFDLRLPYDILLKPLESKYVIFPYAVDYTEDSAFFLMPPYVGSKYKVAQNSIRMEVVTSKYFVETSCKDTEEVGVFSSVNRLYIVVKFTNVGYPADDNDEGISFEKGEKVLSMCFPISRSPKWIRFKDDRKCAPRQWTSYLFEANAMYLEGMMVTEFQYPLNIELDDNEVTCVFPNTEMFRSTNNFGGDTNSPYRGEFRNTLGENPELFDLYTVQSMPTNFIFPIQSCIILGKDNFGQGDFLSIFVGNYLRQGVVLPTVPTAAVQNFICVRSEDEVKRIRERFLEAGLASSLPSYFYIK